MKQLRSFLQTLADGDYSVSQRVLARAALSGFGGWLVAHHLLPRNPTRGLPIERQELLPPRVLSPVQRRLLLDLVARDGSARSAALFALGYWAGCRVSDVSWLLLKNVVLTPLPGVITVGYKNRKLRTVELAEPARVALERHLAARGDADGPYVFVSQRAERLTEAGIHHWFRRLKNLAAPDEYPLVCDLTYHDLRHDFAHRARAAGWTLEEVAFYLGHTNRRGWPVIDAVVRYTAADPQAAFARLPALERLSVGMAGGGRSDQDSTVDGRVDLQ